MSILIVLQILLGIVPQYIAILVTFVGWRFFGTYLQNLFTTRRAKPKQLANGIAVGKELLDRYHQGLAAHAGVPAVDREVEPFRRGMSARFGWLLHHPRVSALQPVWNMGIIQVVAGASCLYAIGELVSRVWHVPIGI